MNNHLSISVIIPTYNSSFWLEKCLAAIKNQDYPAEKVEIIISDGGSQDNTLKVAEKFNCKIINNKKRLAEPGINLGLREASNDICIILAVDNIIEDTEYFKKMSKPLHRNDIFASYTKHLSTKDDNWLTKYWNEFTDPFNHFVYGNAANVRTFSKEYKIIKKNGDYVVYQFDKNNYPMLAFAQGFALKGSYVRPDGTEGDDLLPIIDLIKQNKKMAYVSNTGVVHHCINNLSHCIKKQKWAIGNFFLKKGYGINSRKKYFSTWRKVKMFLWPFYAISFIFPLLRGIYGSIKDKNVVWLYHPFINFIIVLIAFQEFVRIKIFRNKNITERQ